MAGRKTERLAVWGNYPANQPFEQAVASLSASGALAVDSLATMGLNIQKLQIPVYMDHGVVKLAFAPGTAVAPAAAPATVPATGPADALTTTAVCNGGTVNLFGITLDLTAPSPLLTIPPETKVFDNVAMNKVLAATANTYLPIFDDTDASSGTLTFSVHHCDRLPIEELTAEAPSQPALMDFSISFADIQLGGHIIDSIESVGVKGLRQPSRRHPRRPFPTGSRPAHYPELRPARRPAQAPGLQADRQSGPVPQWCNEPHCHRSAPTAGQDHPRQEPAPIHARPVGLPDSRHEVRARARPWTRCCRKPWGKGGSKVGGNLLPGLGGHKPTPPPDGQ